jgi:hypothetical protein
MMPENPGKLPLSGSSLHMPDVSLPKPSPFNDFGLAKGAALS